SHGGMLVDQLKYGHFHFDAKAGDRLFWFTTTGWVMWNVMLGLLLSPASIIIYDGNPGHPDLGVLWDLAERTGMTLFGTSAAYIVACMKAGLEPRRGRDLGALQSVGSTGSSAPTSGSTPRAAAPTSPARSCAAFRGCRSTRPSCRPASSARPSSRGRPRAARWSARPGSW